MKPHRDGRVDRRRESDAGAVSTGLRGLVAIGREVEEVDVFAHFRAFGKKSG
jgi:hypothetical protein